MEEEVNYASVVFKANQHSPPPEVSPKKEETVYDEVKLQSETTEQTGDTNVSAGFIPDKKANKRRRHYQQLACCFGIVCVILLLGIIALCFYIISQEREQNQLRENQTANQNLSNLNHKLSSENENVRKDRNNMTDKLTQANAALESKITNLTVENQQLKTLRDNLTKTIQDMETKWNELNLCQAQWSFDAYCPEKDGERECKPCQDGWINSQSSCYAINNPEPENQTTWDGAQANCKGKNSDLVVIADEEEKAFVNDKSWGSEGTKGYWIGLRVEDGKWKWLNGSHLTEESWIQQPPTDGQCAISVKKDGLKSVKCSAQNQWICHMKALSFKKQSISRRLVETEV